jgi:hypothetical protein
MDLQAEMDEAECMPGTFVTLLPGMLTTAPMSIRRLMHLSTSLKGRALPPENVIEGRR